jgi:hypothetical protein
MVLFDFNNYSSNILNSPLVPVPNLKSITFSPLGPVQSPLEIEEKSFFLGSCIGPNA